MTDCLAGIWYNELGSYMDIKLTPDGGGFDGEYYNNASGDAKGLYKTLVGRYAKSFLLI